jgi:hypothetical protein
MFVPRKKHTYGPLRSAGGIDLMGMWDGARAIGVQTKVDTLLVGFDEWENKKCKRNKIIAQKGGLNFPHKFVITVTLPVDTAAFDSLTCAVVPACPSACSRSLPRSQELSNCTYPELD